MDSTDQSPSRSVADKQAFDRLLRTRWRIPFAGFLLGLMGGLSYTWGVYINPLVERFGWTTAMSALPYSVFMVVFALSMVPAGRLQDKLGPRRVASAGEILFFTSYGLAALVGRLPQLWWLVLTYGLIGGAACGLTYSSVSPPARKWYPDRPGLAVAVAVMGFGLGALFFAPIKAAILIPRVGIEGTLLVDAVMASVVSLFAAALMRNPPAGWAPPVSVARKVVAVQREASPGEELRSPVFWVLWSTMALVVAGGQLSIGLIPSYGKLVLGLTPTKAALATAAFAAFNGFGRPVAGYLGDRFGAMRVMILTCVLQSVTFLLFPVIAVNQLTLYMAAACLGWGFAATLALFPTLTSICFGVEHLGANFGLVFTAFALGAFAPTVGSLVYDATGTYTPVFMAAGVLAVAGLVLSVVLHRKYDLA
ncbi:MAG: OFA family MFS transporter [Caldiserica bacterium]|nr:OFA family MFS transporter [Caldisericota bacterium]